MAEDGGEIVIVEGEEQEGEVGGVRVLYHTRDVVTLSFHRTGPCTVPSTWQPTMES